MTRSEKIAWTRLEITKLQCERNTWAALRALLVEEPRMTEAEIRVIAKDVLGFAEDGIERADRMLAELREFLG